MAVRNPGRYLAPVALVAVIVAVVVVTTDVLGHNHAARPHTVARAAVVHPPIVAKKSFYVIKPGDSLSSISVKTGVPISTLQNLNPSVDPSALQTGQRLRLRP